MTFWTPETGNWKLLPPPLHNEPIRCLPVPRLVALGRLSPWRHRVPATRGFAFATAQRMVNRVHCHAADMRPLAQPAAPACLADRDVLVIDVADLTDGRQALDVDLPDFAGRHLHRRVFT